MPLDDKTRSSDSRSDRDRLASEKAFHDERFAEENREAQDKYYAALAEGTAAYLADVMTVSRDADVLEYGCAQGVRSVEIARVARELIGIDISGVAIRQAVERAAANGIKNAHFSVMNAEQTSLPDARFDLVFGSGIIHHLDLERSFAEIARVLRPGGRAIFWEPLGHNPAINLYRMVTPSARTPDEHPLRRRDFAMARRHFASVDLRFCGFTTLATIPFRNRGSFPRMLGIASAVDHMLGAIPGVRWGFWYCCMTLHR